MKLNTYSDFVFESLILETKLAYTEKFESLLKSMNGMAERDGEDNISTFITRLLYHFGKDLDIEVSLFDVSNRNDRIKFIQGDKLDKKNLDIKSYFTAGKDFKAVDKLAKRTKLNEIKVGKLFRSLSKQIKLDILNDQDIEKLVNYYKSSYDMMNSKKEFKIVKGKDIVKYYDCNQYAIGDGSLNNSCMSNYEKVPLINFYAKIDKVSMLILLDKKGKVYGRALVWNTDKVKVKDWNEEYYTQELTILDRVYTVYDSDIELFKKYAIQQGWAYRIPANTYEHNGYFYNGKEIDKCLCVILDNISTHGKEGYEEFPHFPYLDTFKYFKPWMKLEKDSEIEYMLMTKDSTIKEVDNIESISVGESYLLRSEEGGYRVRCEECEGAGCPSCIEGWSVEDNH